MSDESAEEATLAFDYDDRDREAIDVISDYIPEKEDYSAKTVLESDHPELLARLELLPEFYDELDEYEELISRWIESYEKRRTSVGGISRSEFAAILQSLSGGGGTSTDSNTGMLEKMLKPGDGDD